MLINLRLRRSQPLQVAGLNDIEGVRPMSRFRSFGPRRYLSKLLSWCCLLYAVLPAAAGAAPFVPADDAQVLERLPVRAGDPVARELRALRAVLAGDPNSQSAALDLAWRYFELAMSEGDPRYIGYAEAALRPWWTLPAPPAPVLTPSATVKLRVSLPLVLSVGV